MSRCLRVRCRLFHRWLARVERPVLGFSTPILTLAILFLSGSLNIAEAQTAGEARSRKDTAKEAVDSTRADDGSAQWVVPVDGASIRLGAVTQFDLTARADDQPSGFRLRNARLRTTITSYGLEAFLQTEFVRSPPIFDLRLRYVPHPRLRVTAGLFKSPFSRSHLTPRPRLPLAERPVAVDAIAPRRQVGVALRVTDPSNRLAFEGGVFNGTGREIEPNDNEHFLYVARLSGTHHVREWTVGAGINGAYSIDDGVPLRDLVDEPFAGTRVAGGVDVHVSRQNAFLSAEALAIRLSPTEPGRADRTGTGGYVALGVPLFTFGRSGTVQSVARYEQFDPNTDRDDGRDLARVSAGINVRPQETVLLQWTGVLPVRDQPGRRDGALMTLRLQLALR